MALFKASPEKQLTTAITARDKLCTRLTDTEAAVIDLRSAAERLALDGASDEMLSTAEGKTRAMLDRAETLRAALAQATADVARIEHEQAEADDAAQREKTAAKVELLAREVIEAANALAAAGAALAECATKAVVAAPEAGGVHAFALACREIPAAGELIAKLLRVHSAAVLAGTAPPLLAKPPEAYVAPVVAKPALTQVFALHALRWVDEHGMVRQIGKWRDVELPAAAAVRALRLGLCAPMGDPRRQKLVGQSPGHPEPGWLNDLDAETGPDIAAKSAEATAVEPIQHSAFQPVDRGPGFTLRVAR